MVSYLQPARCRPSWYDLTSIHFTCVQLLPIDIAGKTVPSAVPNNEDCMRQPVCLKLFSVQKQILAKMLIPVVSCPVWSSQLRSALECSMLATTASHSPASAPSSGPLLLVRRCPPGPGPVMCSGPLSSPSTCLGGWHTQQCLSCPGHL